MATKLLCFACFDSIEAPLFVTWLKNDKLRGCIGNLSPLPIGSGVRDYAIRAAVEFYSA
jgi:AMMECR1 domain-containing protein